jgi:sugar (pentulose or hexulose) kinase
MTKPPVAVVDIGKTTAKVALVGPDGALIDARTQPNRVLPGPPYAQADVEGLWRFVLESLANLCGRHPLAGIAVTTHGATAALVAGRELALPVLDYEHNGPDAVAAEYDAVRPDFAETLSPRLPAGLNLGAQIFWQARTFPDAFARVTAILTYPQYWAWRLSGIAASEVTSLGCHTDLWAPVAGRFSSLVEKNVGWQARFPPVRAAADELGPILSGVAAAAGISPSTPIICGIHDSNASLLPWLRRVPAPFSVVSSGTWTIVMTVGGSLERLDPERDSLANVDAFGRPIPTARFMGGREYATLIGDATAPATPDDAAAVLAADVFPLPTFAPGVGPFPAGAGRWHGDLAALAPAARTAAADLYLALVTRECLALAGLGERIVVEGPLARNALFCGLLAALVGVPVHPSPDATGTAAGAAALLGGAALGGVPAAVTPRALAGLAEFAERWRTLAVSEGVR